jgi:hypothetical protein
MAVTRPLKEGSVTTYQQKVAAGFPDILASEMDADLDTIYAAWNGGVATANLIDGSVTTPKLATAPNGAGTANLNDLAVTTAKLADGAVTWPKLTLQSYARVHRNAALSIPNNAQTAITFDTIETNVGGLFVAGSPDRFTIQQNGVYLFGGVCGLAGAAGGANRLLFIQLAGANLVEQSGPVGPTVFFAMSTIAALTAGQAMQLIVYQDSGGALALNVAGTPQPTFWIARMA